jgi:protein-tyrosine phosphatase
MRYGVIFNLQGLLLILMSIFMIKNSIIWVITFWLGINFILLALSYLFKGVKIYRKTDNGKINLLDKIILLPLFIFTLLIWHLSRLLSSEDNFNQITNNVFIGRRLLANELPENIVNYIDLTSEFEEFDKIVSSKNYILLPILDGSVPETSSLDKALDKIKEGRSFIHCAQGHGRTGLFTIILLIKNGDVTSYEEAIKMLNSKRPKLRLNKSQIEFVKKYLENKKYEY